MSHVCDGRDRACVSCAEISRRHDLVRAAMTVDDQLDDIKRARIWGDLEDRLSVPAPRRTRWPYAMGAVAFAATVAIVMIARAPQHDERHTVTIPADTTATSRLGPHTRAALVGPAQLDLVGEAGEATTVRLRSGTLLADFEGGPGRTLRIETGRAVIEVVGTLFAVEIRDGETCTSVAHGRVRVSTVTGVIHVADGQQYCTGESLRPIASETRDALERHQSVITARAESAAPSVASAPPARASAPPAAAPPAARRPDPSATPDPSTTPAPRREMSSDVRPPPPPRATRVATTVEQARPPATALGLPPASPAPSSPLPSPPPPSPTSTPPSPTASPTPPSPRSSAPSSPPLPSPTSSPPPPPSPTSSPPPPPSPTPPPPRSPRTPTAEELYATAETALAARDAKAADRALATLLATHPASPLVDQVLYERARIAYQQRSWARARHHLERLAAIPDTRLAEPGRYLTCRIAVETHDREAARCLADYRKRFPRAPHDLDALALLVQLAHGAGGCARAASLVDELVRLYPRTTLAAAWRRRCPEVAP